MPPKKRRLPPARDCATCGERFQPVRGTSQFCSPQCVRHDHTCVECGSDFKARSNKSQRCDGCKLSKRPLKRDPRTYTRRATGDEARRQERRANIAEALAARERSVLAAYRTGAAA